MMDEDGWQGIVGRYALRYFLSPQECRLLLAAVQGAADKRIADDWGCSRATVSTYWKRIFVKTGMRPQRDVLAHVLRFAGTLLARGMPSVAQAPAFRPSVLGLRDDELRGPVGPERRLFATRSSES